MVATIACLAGAGVSPAGEVATIAGNGRAEYAGDGGPGETAGVGGPFGIALGPDGALYFCETTNHVIRRWDPKSGLLSTVAGRGEKGYSGDGGPAVAAKLNEPYEIRFDQNGNLLFVEMQNHLVRKVDAKTGVISTVAGTGKLGFSGDGGPAIEATMNRPHSIALDKEGNLYICDIGNHRIRLLDSKTGVIETFAGTGERKPTPDGARIEGTPLNGPRALDYEAGTNELFLALREGNAVYRLELNDQTLHHIAGTGKSGYAGDGGPAKQALLSGPKGVALGPEGDIYLADTESHTIRVIRRKSGLIETLVGDGKKGDGPDGDPRRCRMDRPHGVFVDSAGAVSIGDSNNNKVRKYVPR
jgi:streptogramin lyase